MIDRGGAGVAVGQAVLERAEVVFAWGQQVRAGQWARATFQRYGSELRQGGRAELGAGTQGACPKTAATCRELLKCKNRDLTCQSCQSE